MNRTPGILLSILFVLLVLGGIIVGLGGALTPLLGSFALAYLVFPVIRRLEQWNIHRDVAVLVVFILVLGGLAAFGLFVVPPLVADGPRWPIEVLLPVKAMLCIYWSQVSSSRKVGRNRRWKCSNSSKKSARYRRWYLPRWALR